MTDNTRADEKVVEANERVEENSSRDGHFERSGVGRSEERRPCVVQDRDGHRRRASPLEDEVEWDACHRGNPRVQVGFGSPYANSSLDKDGQRSTIGRFMAERDTRVGVQWLCRSVQGISDP